MSRYNDYNYREFRKGFLKRNPTYPNTIEFDTGKHLYKAAYNFKNRNQDGQVAVSKGVNNFNNAFLITPNNSAVSNDLIQENNTSNTSSGWNDDTLGGNLDNLKATADFTTTHTNIGLLEWCGWDRVYPLAIEITKITGKVDVFYIAYGVRELGETITYCDSGCNNCPNPTHTYIVAIHKNIFQLGFIPYPTVGIDIDVVSPISAWYYSMRPRRSVEIVGCTEKDIYCAPSNKRCLTIWLFKKGFEQHENECGDGMGVAQCYKKYTTCVSNGGDTSTCWCAYLLRGYSMNSYATIDLKIYWRRIKLNYVC